MILSRYAAATYVLALLLFCSCARPTMPTGGPQDKEPPEVIKTIPESGTTNFSGQEVYFEFSEFIQRESVTKALEIQPSLNLSYSLKWKRKGVYVQFDDPLPEETTIIVTLGTDLQDVNRNSIEAPISVAFSTGATISENEIEGKVLSAETGRGSKGERVFLFREDMSISEAAYYVVQTDSSGAFSFSYLSPGTYRSFWVQDRNANRKWEQARENAQPFNKEYISVEGDTTFSLGSIYIQSPDTTKPSLQGVGLLTNSRFRLRFSEPIHLTDSTRMEILSSDSSSLAAASPLYVQPGDSTVVMAQSAKPTIQDTSYTLRLRNFSDRSGNVQRLDQRSFLGSSQEDTTQQRLVTTNVAPGILDSSAVIATYAKPIRSSTLVDSIIVITGESIASDWAGIQADRNKIYVNPDPIWKAEAQPQVRFWNPRTEDRVNVNPTIWNSTELAGLEWSPAADSLGTDSVMVVLKTEEVVPQSIYKGKYPTTYTVDQLKPISYQLMLFQDMNGNGQWDPGSVIPFVAPEPIWVRRNISLSASMVGTVNYELGSKTE